MLLVKDIQGTETARSMKDLIASTGMVMYVAAFAGLAVAAGAGRRRIREVRPYTVALWVLAALSLSGALVLYWLLGRVGPWIPDNVGRGAALSFGADVLLALGLFHALVGLARAKGHVLAEPLTIASAVGLLVVVPLGPILSIWWFVSVRPVECDASG
jgi:hypothetical protein